MSRTAGVREQAIDEESSGRPSVAALERALAILGCFRKDDRGLPLSEIAHRTGLYKSTILRLCASLERFGYLIRLPSGRFVLGGAALRLGQVYQASFDIGEFVLPAMQQLSSNTGHSASLWILESSFRVCLYRVEAPGSVRDATAQIGERCPLNRGGSAATILRAFSGAKGEQFEKIRRQRVVISLGEFVPELAAISCPVLLPDNNLLGALSLGGFRSQFTAKTISRLKTQVLAAADEIATSLGRDGRRAPNTRTRKQA